MKGRKITSLLLISALICGTSACTQNTSTEEQPSLESSVQSSQSSENSENEVKPVKAEENQGVFLYDFEIEENQTIRSVSAFENDTKLYLVISKGDSEDDENMQIYINVYDNSGESPELKEKIELPDKEKGTYITNCRIFDNGKKFFYSIVKYKDEAVSEIHPYIADIKDNKIEKVKELTVDKIISDTYAVKKKFGIDDISNDVMMLIYSLAVKDNEIFVNGEFMCEINNEAGSTFSAMPFYASINGDSLEITLHSSDDIELEYEDFGETSYYIPETGYFDENGNINLVSLYNDGEENTRAAFNNIDLKENKVTSSSSVLVQEMIFNEDLSDYVIDDIFGLSISDDNKNLYYLIGKDEEYKVCRISLETLKKGDDISSKTQPEEYKGNEFDKYDTSAFEMTYRSKTDTKEKSGIYYEIFVRSFADSDGNGIGDLNGITQKLDYLSDLGIDGIWLMPINKSSSYHGYDIDDYYTVNPDYGTEEDFKNLIDEAHKKGIKVIMDMVINHTGYNNEWFQEAIADSENKYKNYYRWTVKEDTKDYSNIKNLYGSSVWNKIGNEYYYAIFGGQMPDLNYNNPEVREEIKNVAKKYLEMGVDGFRLDAAIHIYANGEFQQMSDRETANLQWWNEFAAYCEKINPNVYIVGEAWEDENVFAEYAKPFDSKFDFAFQSEMLSAVNSGKAETSDGKDLSEYLSGMLDEYAKYDDKFIDAVFAANHDQDRLITQVKSEEKSKLAAAVYMTLPGNPFIYYGEEIGMKGSGDDIQKRTGFLWGNGDKFNTSWIESTDNKDTKTLSEQRKDSDSLYNYYKNLIAERKSSEALQYGDFKAISTNNSAVMSYSRTYNGKTAYVVHNFSDKKVDVEIDVNGTKQVFGNGEYSSNGNKITLGAYSSIILE